MGISSKLKNIFFVQFRIWKYKKLSTCKKVIGKPNVFHPLLLNGNGEISFGKNVQIGVVNSPGFYSQYTYLEARNPNSKIQIGHDTAINNGFSVIAFDEIRIGNNVLIGNNCCIMDNDGHSLKADKRNSDEQISKPVNIDNNVFIGNNVTILKGVCVGENSVIGNGSIVTSTIPANVIVAGNPAKIIRSL